MSGKHRNNKATSTRGPKPALLKVQEYVDAGLNVYVSNDQPLLNAEEGLRWGSPEEVREVLGSFGSMLLDPNIGAYPWQLKWIGEAFVRIGKGEDAEVVLGLKRTAGRSSSVREDRRLMNQYAQLRTDSKLTEQEAIAVIAFKNLYEKEAPTENLTERLSYPKISIEDFKPESKALVAEGQRVRKHLLAATKRWRDHGCPSAAIPQKQL